MKKRRQSGAPGLRAPARATWACLFCVFGATAQGTSELEAWERVKSNHHGALNARACSDYLRFVETYPQGRLAPLVKAKFLVHCESGHTDASSLGRASRAAPVPAASSDSNGSAPLPKRGVARLRITSDRAPVTDGARIGPQARYLDRADGTVTDAVTGLMWMRCAIGQSWTGRTCKGRPTAIGWSAAAAYSIRFAGHDDWRVPTIDELATLVYCSNGRPDYYTNGRNASDQASDWGCYGEPAKDHLRPTLAPGVFPNNPASLYWSSSRDAPLPGPNGVYFGYGSISNTNTTGFTHIRMVRVPGS